MYKKTVYNGYIWWEPDECNLSGDDLLKTMHGTITLVPDGLCLMSAIEVDRLECFYCCTRNCHYKVQCEQCEQFNCGAWIRAKSPEMLIAILLSLYFDCY